MESFSRRLVRAWGLGDPLPGVSIVLIVAACVALLGIPASYVIHHVNVGLGVTLNEIVFIAGIPLLVVYVMKFDRRALFRFALPPARSIIPLLLVTLGALIIIDYLTWASEQIVPLPEKYRLILNSIMAVSSPLEFVYKIFLLCFIPGICEELFFRGFAQTSLMQRKGKWFGIVIAAALFALLHGNPWYFHLYFVLGFFLSWVYATSGTLIVPIACHIINNAWTFTNHTLGTTLPWEHEPTSLNLIIFSSGIVLLIAGGWLFLYTSKMSRK